MKVNYAPTDKISLEFEVKDQQELVEKMAEVQEIFANKTCGKCHSNDTIFQVRRVGKFTYHEFKCTKCHHVLSFGHGEHGLYPRRYEMDGTKPKLVDGKRVYIPNNGWTKWSPESDTQE